jgi:hypothetical protein
MSLHPNAFAPPIGLPLRHSKHKSVRDVSEIAILILPPGPNYTEITGVLVADARPLLSGTGPNRYARCLHYLGFSQRPNDTSDFYYYPEYKIARVLSRGHVFSIPDFDPPGGQLHGRMHGWVVEAHKVALEWEIYGVRVGHAWYRATPADFGHGSDPTKGHARRPTSRHPSRSASSRRHQRSSALSLIFCPW